jgi:carbon storage regulator
MLAISRRPGESVVVQLASGEKITITVVRISGRQVRLAVDAPKQVPVVRSELLEDGVKGNNGERRTKR